MTVPFSEAFQCAGSSNGDTGNNKSGADNAKCKTRPPEFVSGFVVNIPISHLQKQTQKCSAYHDSTTHKQRPDGNFSYAIHFSGTIVVTNDWTHSLDNSTCRKIKERLQFVVNPKHYDVNVGVGGENTIKNDTKNEGRARFKMLVRQLCRA